MKAMRIGHVLSLVRNPYAAYANLKSSLRKRIQDQSGQGTTEYAILVGVLVVIAIIAITLFRPKIQELWDAIANGINGL